MGMSMYYKSPFYETPDIPDCISPPLLEAITRLQPQLCGFNANLLSKKTKKKTNKEKQRRQQRKLEKAKFILRLSDRVTGVTSAFRGRPTAPAGRATVAVCMKICSSF